MGRAPCCDKASVKKGPWSPEEDAKLKAYIDNYGTGNNWIALPQKIGLKRCGKSCRLRWLNYLRPNIKHGGFSEEEDNIICSLYISIGSRWSIIAAQLPGRTDNDIKNYWNTRLKKKLLGRRKQSNINRQSAASCTSHHHHDQDAKDSSSCAPELSHSALERLQLHMQLQSFQNPLSFYNSHPLWPKLHPLQEKMIQSLQFLSGSSTTNPNLMQVVPHDPGEVHKMNGQYFKEANLKMDGLLMGNCLNGTMSCLDSSSFGFNSSSEGIQLVSNFQAEVEGSTAVLGFPTQEDSVADDHELDCFKEMVGSKDGLIWWSNDQFDQSNSASSNSWDSNSLLQNDHHEGMMMYHEEDSGLGYHMCNDR